VVRLPTLRNISLHQALDAPLTHGPALARSRALHERKIACFVDEVAQEDERARHRLGVKRSVNMFGPQVRMRQKIEWH